MVSTTIEISEVDQAFAEMIMRRYDLNDSWLRSFLAEMMAKTRHGHICIDISQETIARLPDCLLAKGDLADRLLKVRGPHLYFHRYWHLETKLLLPIARRLKQCTKMESAAIEGLNQMQCHAVSSALTHALTLISGGPGTGKTHTISHIVKQFSGKRIALTAPTGKAVSKLSESIVNPEFFFGTLHKLLGIKRAKDVLKTPSLLPYDVVIVDECSMVDIGMWGTLFEACSSETKLILVGDANQLPPVEGGNIFQQLCAFFKKTKQTGYSELTTCMRTDKKDLQAIASLILKGSFEDLPRIDIPPVRELVNIVNPVFTRKLDDHISTELLLMEAKKFQILNALRRGQLGCDALNRALFQIIKGNIQKNDRLAIPIIVTRNAPDLGLSNGDMGIWIHGPEEQVLFKDQIIPKALAPPFELAYILSVHKSQGSEYEDVYLLLPPGSEHFGRSVLYTAVTRAQSQLTIAGSCETVQLCAQNNVMRLAGLSERLGEILCVD